MKMVEKKAIVLALALCLAPAALGCETFVETEDCDPSAAANPDITWNATQTGCAYQSSTPGQSLLLFNGGMHYALGTFGCTPTAVETYLSFDQFGDVGGGQVAMAAGNQAVILEMDAKGIRVANDSCSDYWLLVTAQLDPTGCSCQ